MRLLGRNPVPEFPATRPTDMISRIRAMGPGVDTGPGQRGYRSRKLEIRNPEMSTETLEATTDAMVALPTPSAPWVLV